MGVEGVEGDGVCGFHARNQGGAALSADKPV